MDVLESIEDTELVRIGRCEANIALSLALVRLQLKIPGKIRSMKSRRICEEGISLPALMAVGVCVPCGFTDI